MTLNQIYAIYNNSKQTLTDTDEILADVKEKLTTYYNSPEGQFEISDSPHNGGDVTYLVEILMGMVISWIRTEEEMRKQHGTE